VANSRFVARRIAKFYGRESVVVNPPIDTGLFELTTAKEDYYVTAGRFVPFKRLDLVAAAFARMPNKRLVILGDGPEMQKIRAVAGPNVEFPGFLAPAQVNAYLSKAKAFLFPSEEDFGIVPVEAQSCGTPVIAYGRGGALETVVAKGDGSKLPPTGRFFDVQTPEAVMAAVEAFEQELADRVYDAKNIHDHAQDFSIDSFKRKFQQEIDRAIAKYGQFM
jgi:glycosyltransferase involved in cell wall biosynthesis